METIEAQKRQTGPGSKAKALRRSGWIPAVVYGQKVKNLPLQVRGQELQQLLRQEGISRPFVLRVDGQEYTVMVYERQYHPVHGELLHVDFKQIDMRERVHTTVPLVLVGKPETGVASLARHSLDVVCLPSDIPESIPVRVEGLQAGDVMVVKDLDIPPNIEVDVDEMEVIVSVLAPQAIPAAPAEAEEEAEVEKAEQTGAGT